ncbi:hypothetical protein B932_3657 (plasmid) [Gluconobacter oxydans H24]|nr:hypothetical protein B932_3657 [Gluconobacter oxydans H24]
MPLGGEAVRTNGAMVYEEALFYAVLTPCLRRDDAVLTP